MFFRGKFDIYTEISPAVWTMKIFGICNYGFKRNLKRREIKLSKVAHAYCLILLILHTFTLFLYVKDSMSEEITSSPYEHKMFIFLLVASSAFSIIIRASTVLKNLNIDIIYNMLANFDYKMSYNSKNYKNVLCFQYCLISSTLPDYYCHALFIDVMYPTIILSLWWRFRTFNSKLQNFIESFQNNTLKCSTPMATINDFQLKSISILNLRNLYDFLTQICKLVDSSFSIPVLISTAFKFIALTFKLYIFVTQYLRNKSFL
ncbi:hypothetical protein L9F63_022115, partial [Diploptera punctata]